MKRKKPVVTIVLIALLIVCVALLLGRLGTDNKPVGQDQTTNTASEKQIENDETNEMQNQDPSTQEQMVNSSEKTAKGSEEDPSAQQEEDLSNSGSNDSQLNETAPEGAGRSTDTPSSMDDQNMDTDGGFEPLEIQEEYVVDMEEGYEGALSD